ncbi:hypothetical protein VTN96DRAFT_9274 [Rasamsonia emersonii]
MEHIGKARVVDAADWLGSEKAAGGAGQSRAFDESTPRHAPLRCPPISAPDGPSDRQRSHGICQQEQSITRLTRRETARSNFQNLHPDIDPTWRNRINMPLSYSHIRPDISRSDY